jgi:hypothetical protein
MIVHYNLTKVDLQGTYFEFEPKRALFADKVYNYASLSSDDITAKAQLSTTLFTLGMVSLIVLSLVVNFLGMHSSVNKISGDKINLRVFFFFFFYLVVGIIFVFVNLVVCLYVIMRMFFVV